MQRCEFESAVLSFTEAIKHQPDFIMAYSNRAMVLALTRQPTAAIEDANLVIKSDPQFAHAYTARGIAFAHQGKVEQALADANEATRLAPKYAFAHYLRGEVFKAQKRYEDAIGTYKTTLHKNPNFALAYFGLGVCYFEMEKLDEAISALQNAIQLAPGHMMSYIQLGLTLILKDRYEEAIEIFKKSIQIRPHNSAAYYGIGLAYTGLYDSERAILAFSKSLEFDRNNALACQSRAGEYALIGKLNYALDDSNEAVRLMPGLVQNYTVRGHIYFLLQMFTESLSDFNRALKIQPQNKFALAGKAINLAAVNRMSEAILIWKPLAEDDKHFRDAKTFQTEYRCADEFEKMAHQIIDSINSDDMPDNKPSI